MVVELVRKPTNVADRRNPSVLLPPRPDSPLCTHDLFRPSKTSSTAIYNALQEDDALHEHICWERAHLREKQDLKRGCDEHCFPEPGHPWPVIVPIRHPLERLRSVLAYEGYREEKRSAIVVSNETKFWNVHDRRMVRGPVSYLRHYVPSSTRAKQSHEPDIYLCVSRNSSSLAKQLRDAFDDERVREVPMENVNHRARAISTADGRPLSDYVHKLDWSIWESLCVPSPGEGRPPPFPVNGVWTEPLTRVSSQQRGGHLERNLSATRPQRERTTPDWGFDMSSTDVRGFVRRASPP
jgi:hypothetical protein